MDDSDGTLVEADRDGYEHLLPFDISADLCVTDIDCISLYGHVKHQEGRRSGAALVAIPPPNRMAAEADHCFLTELWAAQAEFAGKMPKFHLHRDSYSSRDEWTEHAGFAPAHLTRLAQLLRTRIFDAWLAVAPDLEHMSGSFEIFNPAIGANMCWHRDGVQSARHVDSHCHLTKGAACCVASRRS